MIQQVKDVKDLFMEAVKVMQIDLLAFNSVVADVNLKNKGTKNETQSFKIKFINRVLFIKIYF